MKYGTNLLVRVKNYFFFRFPKLTQTLLLMDYGAFFHSLKVFLWSQAHRNHRYYRIRPDFLYRHHRSTQKGTPTMRLPTMTAGSRREGLLP